MTKKTGIFCSKKTALSPSVFWKCKMGNSHKGWAIYNFRNKKQRLQGKYLSMHRLLLPAKESFKGRSGQYFLGNNPLRRTQPFGCLELFSFKIPNLPQGVISVFRAFKQISSLIKVRWHDNRFEVNWHPEPTLVLR